MRVCFCFENCFENAQSCVKHFARFASVAAAVLLPPCLAWPPRLPFYSVLFCQEASGPPSRAGLLLRRRRERLLVFSVLLSMLSSSNLKLGFFKLSSCNPSA